MHNLLPNVQDIVMRSRLHRGKGEIETITKEKIVRSSSDKKEL